MVDIVSVDAPAPPPVRVMLVGVRFVVRLDDDLKAVRLTVPVNPLILPKDIVEEAEEPCTTLMLPGLAEMEKSAALTKTEIVTEWERDPLIPDMVRE